MCERKTETNKHILCYCTNPQIVMKRREAKGKIIALIDEHKNTAELKQVATILYGTNDKGRALNLKNEKTIPAKWRQSWNKKEEDRTQYIETVEGRAAEVAIKLGNIAPLWTGVLTKALIWLMKDIVPQKRKKIIKQYIQIPQNYAAETWVIRCEKTYGPKVETERYNKRRKLQHQKQEAKNIIRKLNITGGITTQQIMNMSTIQKENLENKYKPSWTQSTLRDLKFSSTVTEKKKKKRTQPEIQKETRTVKKTNAIINTKQRYTIKNT